MSNPFTSNLFETVWAKHFNAGKKGKRFKFIQPLSFYRTKILPLYINIGRNLTKGIYYKLNYEEIDFKRKVFLIYDVPDFFNVKPFEEGRSALKCKIHFQYQGFLLNFNEFPTAEDYIASRISSKNRRGLRSRQDRLEKCFDIDYKFHTNDLNEKEFDILFAQFHELLSKRFSEKQVHYHHLRGDKWAFHKEYVFAMMQESKASLFVIYNNNVPIGVTLNIHSDTMVFVALTVFDPDYYKFNIGKTTIVKIIDWCYANNFKIADFSKGDFDFKHEWCNEIYDFNYHILYDSKSLLSSFMAWKIELYLQFKLYLRKNNANVFYRKALYQLKGYQDDTYNLDYKENALDRFEPNSDYKMIHLDDEKFDFFKRFVYSYLFLNSMELKDVKIYMNNATSQKEFVIQGIQNSQQITFN